ncbi:MAG TPA: hypothetical protein PK264_09035, partial [Hyphomicrobiaceae bacterium]|nr:hypothetical protein [Hyphomicrobiaceae bacterium]
FQAALGLRPRVPGLRAALPAAIEIDVVDCASQIGSGALPLETLESAGLRLASRSIKAESIAAALRKAPIPVVGRINDGAVILDLRCLDDPRAFAAGLTGAASALSARTEA